MKKPLPNDYGLTQEDIEWGDIREKEINKLDSNRFISKIWISLIILILFGLILRCAQIPTCHFDNDSLMETLKVVIGLGLLLTIPAILLGIILKWICEIWAKQDSRLKLCKKYKIALLKYYGISDEEIASDYGDFISKHYRSDIIWDVSKLPHPKERIMDALCRLNAKRTTTDFQKKSIANTFIYLAQFQEGVGEKDLYMLGLDILKEDDHFNSAKKYTMELAKKIVGSDEERNLYGKYNMLVMKEMNTLPNKLIEGTVKAMKICFGENQ